MGAPGGWTSGTQNVTADIAIGTAGATTRVFSITVVSTGGGGAVVSLKNGTSASDTNYVTMTGTTSTGVTLGLGTYGQVFSAGCFVDVDVNTANVLVAYSQ